MSTVKDGGHSLLTEILQCERQVWQALITGDAAADEAALHVDFLGVFPSGFSNRADHSGQLAQGATVAAYEIGETRLLQLGPQHVCLSYLARYQRPGQAVWEEMYVSSIWQRQDPIEGRGWINIFSQDTPADGRQLV